MLGVSAVRNSTSHCVGHLLMAGVTLSSSSTCDLRLEDMLDSMFELTDELVINECWLY